MESLNSKDIEELISLLNSVVNDQVKMETTIRNALAMPFRLSKQQMFKFVTLQFVLEQGAKIGHAITDPVNNTVEIIYNKSLPANWLDENSRDFRFRLNEEKFVVSVYERLDDIMVADLSFQKPNGKVVARSVQFSLTQLEDPQSYTPNNCEHLVLAYNTVVMEFNISFVEPILVHLSNGVSVPSR